MKLAGVRAADVVAARLAAQRLDGALLDDSAEVVRWFGAVQSQDLPAAMWAVALRTDDASRKAITEAIDAGAVLRTHVLRPTWHFVHRDDARWLLALTGPRVLRGMAPRLHRLELDSTTMLRAFEVFSAVLRDSVHATRTEFGAALRAAGIAPDGQRLPHLLGAAELHMLLISGPSRGARTTYSVFDARAGPLRITDRDAQLAELAIRYFRSHGPAGIPDFTWWAGLTVQDARRGIAAAGAALERIDIDGDAHWCSAGAMDGVRRHAGTHLLPVFDEYTVAYRNRDFIVDPRHAPDIAQLPFGLLSNVVVHDGLVAGAWSREQRGAADTLTVRWFGTARKTARCALQNPVQRLAQFLQGNVELVTGSARA